MEGSPAASDSAAINDVLLERQARANDAIWLPGAQIEIVSPLAAAILTGETFPKVDDPRPLGVGPGETGDIFDPMKEYEEKVANEDFSEPFELTLAVESCRLEWDKLAERHGVSLKGPIALNNGAFVDVDHLPTVIEGWGGYSTWSPKSAHPCVIPSGATTASGGFIAVIDASLTGDPAHDAQLISHELGHVLYLSHGNGEDDDRDGYYDQRCDPWEDAQAPTPTVLHPDADRLTDSITDLQRGTSREIAYIYTGSRVDSGAEPVEGRAVSDQSADLAGDVGVASIDLTSVQLVVHVNREYVTLTQGVVGLVSPTESNTYYAFIDRDASAATGGNPGLEETLQLPTQLEGVDLVIEIVVDPDRRASATVWWYDDLEQVFVDVTDGGVEEVYLTQPEGGENPIPLFDVVTIRLGLGASGNFGQTVNIQMVASNGQEFDVTPGEGGTGPPISQCPCSSSSPRGDVTSATCCRSRLSRCRGGR